MAQPVEKAATVIFPEQAALIPAQEIPKLQKEALQGSSEAAHRLATYYETIKLQLDEAIYWNQIRVENGDTDARYDLGACLIAMSDPASRIRGRYWLMQLQSNGPPKLVKAAGSMLESLDEKEKYEKMNKH
jgi:TPR repeat protein